MATGQNLLWRVLGYLVVFIITIIVVVRVNSPSSTSRLASRRSAHSSAFIG
jgi:hypothetical protein